MFDRKTKLMFLLGLLNDAYAEAKSIIVSVSDFIESHPEMRDEIEEFRLAEVVSEATNLEKKIFDIMEELKKEIYQKGD
jgi:hypothetical protein